MSSQDDRSHAAGLLKSFSRECEPPNEYPSCFGIMYGSVYGFVVSRRATKGRCAQVRVCLAYVKRTHDLETPSVDLNARAPNRTLSSSLRLEQRGNNSKPAPPHNP